ncbi:MAG: hypothetical protein IT539_03310 [Bradyrhizobiaceae bacterium]|nr:hypothetical protein [Bradyrhizobiaceae bacterium]
MWLRQMLCRMGSRALPSGRARLPLLALATFALAACANSDPTVTGSIPQPTGQTIAFESIDGPPRPVFDRLVSALTAEAEQRELPVVSRSGPATWRVRAYLATHIEKKKKQATLAWVWEVFDASRTRAFRLTGEEPLGSPGADAWALCHDALLRKIAVQGFDALSARLGSPAPAAPAPAPEPAEPAVASAEPPQTVAFTDPRQ